MILLMPDSHRFQHHRVLARRWSHSPTQVSPGGFLSGLWSFFAQLNPTNATIAVIVFALVVIVAVIILILEFIHLAT